MCTSTRGRGRDSDQGCALQCARPPLEREAVISRNAGCFTRSMTLTSNLARASARQASTDSRDVYAWKVAELLVYPAGRFVTLTTW
jgi:hypothetical protein